MSLTITRLHQGGTVFSAQLRKLDDSPADVSGWLTTNPDFGQNHALVQVNHGQGLKALEWLRQAVATHCRLTLYKLYPIEEHAGYSKTLKQFERRNTETVDWVVNKNQVGSNIVEAFFIPFRRSDTNPRDWFENMEDNVEAFCQEDRDWIILAVVRKL